MILSVLKLFIIVVKRGNILSDVVESLYKFTILQEYSILKVMCCCNAKRKNYLSATTIIIFLTSQI